MANKLLQRPPETFDKQIDIASPISGQIVQLDTVEDPLIKNSFLGPGAAVSSRSNNVVAPFAGKVLKIIPLDYAIEVKSSVGLKCRIKFGGDTQRLHGAQFTCILREGDTFSAKQSLFTINTAWLKQQGITNICIMTILNAQKLIGVLPTARKYVEASEDPLLSLFV